MSHLTPNPYSRDLRVSFTNFARFQHAWNPVRLPAGDMTQKKRTEAIDSFQRDPSTCVFLLSVRSGAVGINLTAANFVFLLEPCMNPAMEEQ
jgi:SNF2 family DNA or RNA helicase